MLAAIVSRARAMRSSMAGGLVARGRFAAAFAGFRTAGFATARRLVLLGFFDIWGLPCGEPISAPAGARKRAK
jgi:hypothetical protein